MKNSLVLISLLIACFGVTFSCNHSAHQPVAGGTDNKTDGFTIIQEKSKISTGDAYSFIFTFSEKPKMGYIIAKIDAVDNTGNKVDNLEIIGSYGMPTMKGAHDSDNEKFKINKNKTYLLPINVAMPGTWELKIIINNKEKEIFKGKMLFEA